MLAKLLSADGLRCLFCFYNSLGEFMGVSEENRLGVVVFVGDLLVETLFRVVILVGIGVNDLVIGVEPWFLLE